MRKTFVGHLTRKNDVQSWQAASTSVGAAVFFALYGLPHPACADQADSNVSALQEITVTATRREQTTIEVPYSLSVVSAEQLVRANVTDMASLATQVPGLSIYDRGARFAGASAPIIRGLNATSEPRGFRTFEQDPVGTYIGNSPISGYFQLCADLKGRSMGPGRSAARFDSSRKRRNSA
jgi:iron complex outermembrane receptor protein